MCSYNSVRFRTTLLIKALLARLTLPLLQIEGALYLLYPCKSNFVSGSPTERAARALNPPSPSYRGSSIQFFRDLWEMSTTGPSLLLLGPFYRVPFRKAPKSYNGQSSSDIPFRPPWNFPARCGLSRSLYSVDSHLSLLWTVFSIVRQSNRIHLRLPRNLLRGRR